MGSPAFTQRKKGPGRTSGLCGPGGWRGLEMIPHITHFTESHMSSLQDYLLPWDHLPQLIQATFGRWVLGTLLIERWYLYDTCDHALQSVL